MKIKYRDKIYNSEDIPLFLYFKAPLNKKHFSDILINYNIGNYCQLTNLKGALAGNTAITDMRSKIYFCIEDREEKILLQKSMYYEDDADNNAIICSPSDVPEQSLITWIEENISRVN